MADRDSIIVAIELGTSRISGIAGKKKDGSMQIMAYAEEKTTACVRRGMVHNIEKTTQHINNVIAKLQTALHLTISQVYVGVGGQSVRSVRTKVHRNLMTQTYISNEHISSLRTESYEVKVPDCELLENFEQGYVVDSSVAEEPVGVMGTNIEGEYLNVIARRQLKTNIENCFSNINYGIAGMQLSPYELAKNVLTDQEKRAGSVLVDLGAGTTTVVVYKNNIVRHLVTLPIGFANIVQDLTSLQIDEAEAEQILLKYGNAYVEDGDEDETLMQTYTTSYDKKVKVSEIQHIIEARLEEILKNVNNQIDVSKYDGRVLLGGVVLTGGGANMKNIEKAVTRLLNNTEKVRVARTVNVPIIKNSSVTSLVLDNAMSNTIISLLMSGDANCVGERFDNQRNIFEDEKRKQEQEASREAAEEAARVEAEMLSKLETHKNQLRQTITEIDAARKDVFENGRDKKLRKRSTEKALAAGALLTAEPYRDAVQVLEAKDKHRQTLKEASELSDKLKESIETLQTVVRKAEADNSIFNRIKSALDQMVND